MTAIYKRELKAYFTGMTGVVFIAFILFMTGIYTIAMNLIGGYPNFEYALSSLVFYFLLVIPILTMRSYSEDMHLRTDQLLYSLPLRLSSVVLAKYFAGVTVLAIPCGVMCLFPPILSLYGTVNYTAAYASILCLFLLGAALIAMGHFFSSLTESQLIAAVLTIGVFLVLYLITGIATLIPQTAIASLTACLIAAAVLGVLIYALTRHITASVIVGGAAAVAAALVYAADASLYEGLVQTVLEGLDLFSPMNQVLNGIFDMTTVILYLSVSALFVFFTAQSMERKRWGGV